MSRVLVWLRCPCQVGLTAALACRYRGWSGPAGCTACCGEGAPVSQFLIWLRRSQPSQRSSRREPSALAFFRNAISVSCQEMS